MFPSRYFADRFFNERYWPTVGAEAALAIVSDRYILRGSDDQSFELLGTENRNVTIKGTEDGNFELVGV